jgi:hypothetical protein
MLASTQINKLSAKTAFYVGFPIALLFSAAAILILFFPPSTLNISFQDEYIFWFIIGFLAVIPMASGYYLWKAGKKIKNYLDNDYSTIKSSFYFTIRVNFRLFNLLSFIIISSAITYGWQMDNLQESFFIQIGIIVAIIGGVFSVSTFIGTLTTGLLTVQIIKILIASANADLSLPDYAK